LADGSDVKRESDYDVLLPHHDRAHRACAASSPIRFRRDVEKILEAAAGRCPGANGQPWEYLVIKDPKKKKDLYEAFQDTTRSSASGWKQMRPFELAIPRSR